MSRRIEHMLRHVPVTRAVPRSHLLAYRQVLADLIHDAPGIDRERVFSAMEAQTAMLRTQYDGLIKNLVETGWVKETAGMLFPDHNYRSSTTTSSEESDHD